VAAAAAPRRAAQRGASGGALTPSTPAPAGDSSKGTATIAIELPQQGSEKAASDPIINGIKLAVKLAGGTAGGYKLDIPQSAIYDDALNGAHDPQTGANNMSKVVADESDGRGHRPAQLERRRGPDPDLERGGPAPVLAREHEPGPDQGSAGQGPAHQAEQLHPRRHDRRCPGSGRRAVHPRGPEEELRLHHRRHRDLR
jgi:hypothetical protein